MAFCYEAPATLMVMGEYAVLYGEPCLVAAIDRWLRVSLTPRQDEQVVIVSALGEKCYHLDHLPIEPPFSFILGVLNHFKAMLPSGCDISISADFSHEIGFGSSAAVLMATLAAIKAWLQAEIDLFSVAKTILLHVQGRGSGADLAAALLGGMVYYQQTPLTLERLKVTLPLGLTAVYVGYKTPTTVMIQQIAEARSQDETQYDQIFKHIGEQVKQARVALLTADGAAFYQAINTNQALMVNLGVSDDKLNEISQRLTTLPQVQAVKISGSGRGDCLLALGKVMPQLLNDLPEIQVIPVTIGQQGVRCYEP